MKVSDVMSRDVKTLRRNDALDLADQLMKMNRIRHLVILGDDDDLVVGVVSQRDLFLGALARALGFGSAGAKKVMTTLVVKEVMSTDLVTISPEAPLAEAARTMLDRKVGCLPVIEGDELVGIVTEGDFVRLAAR